MILLTSQERKVLLFLSVLFALGLALRAFQKTTGCNTCLIDLFSKKEASDAVDINTAAKEELVALPGIGEKLALAIIAYRSSQGGFKDLDELKKVRGISSSKFEVLKSSFKEITLQEK